MAYLINRITALFGRISAILLRHHVDAGHFRVCLLDDEMRSTQRETRLSLVQNNASLLKTCKDGCGGRMAGEEEGCAGSYDSGQRIVAKGTGFGVQTA